MIKNNRNGKSGREKPVVTIAGIQFELHIFEKI